MIGGKAADQRTTLIGIETMGGTVADAGGKAALDGAPLRRPQEDDEDGPPRHPAQRPYRRAINGVGRPRKYRPSNDRLRSGRRIHPALP